jgi:hypothetical protein
MPCPRFDALCKLYLPNYDTRAANNAEPCRANAWQVKEPFASLLKGDMQGIAATGEKGLWKFYPLRTLARR